MKFCAFYFHVFVAVGCVLLQISEGKYKQHTVTIVFIHTWGNRKMLCDVLDILNSSNRTSALII